MLLLDARSVQLLVFGAVGAAFLGVIAFAVAVLYQRFQDKNRQDPSRG
jgi:hypothetical protein